MQRTFCSIVVVFILVGLSPSPSRAITIGDPFGTHGEGRATNGQTLKIGSGGDVFELDSYVNIGGRDLNGGAPGTSAQLSLDPLPAGLQLAFSPSLSPGTKNLTLTYTLTNNTGGVLNNVTFFAYVDAEIDFVKNSFTNEYGETKGSLGSGAGDPNPDSWQIDEPGFVSGSIIDNLFAGALDNTNHVPQSTPDDVSFALGFTLGSLPPAAHAMINILLAEGGNTLGSFALIQHDSDPTSSTVTTFSGVASVQGAVSAVPEPNTVVLSASGVLGLGLRWGWRHTVRRAQKEEDDV